MKMHAPSFTFFSSIHVFTSFLLALILLLLFLSFMLHMLFRLSPCPFLSFYHLAVHGHSIFSVTDQNLSIKCAIPSPSSLKMYIYIYFIYKQKIGSWGKNNANNVLNNVQNQKNKKKVPGKYKRLLKQQQSVKKHQTFIKTHKGQKNENTRNLRIPDSKPEE